MSAEQHLRPCSYKIIGLNMTQSQIRVNNMRGHGDNLYSIVTVSHELFHVAC